MSDNHGVGQSLRSTTSESERLRRENEQLRQQLQQTTDQLWDLQCNAATTEAEVRAAAKDEVEKLRSEMRFQSSELERMRRDGQRYKRELESVMKVQTSRSQELSPTSPKRAKSADLLRSSKKHGSPRQRRRDATVELSPTRRDTASYVGDSSLENFVHEHFDDFAFLVTLDAEESRIIDENDPIKSSRSEAKIERDTRRRRDGQQTAVDFPRTLKELSEQVLSRAECDVLVSLDVGLCEAERRCFQLLRPHDILARVPVPQLYSRPVDRSHANFGHSDGKSDRTTRPQLPTTVNSAEDAKTAKLSSQLSSQEEMKALTRAVQCLDDNADTNSEEQEHSSSSTNSEQKSKPEESAAVLQRRCANLLQRALRWKNCGSDVLGQWSSSGIKIFATLCHYLRCLQVIGLRLGLLNEDLCVTAIKKILHLLCCHLESSNACLLQGDGHTANTPSVHYDLKANTGSAKRSAKVTVEKGEALSNGTPGNLKSRDNVSAKIDRFVTVKRVPGDNDTESSSLVGSREDNDDSKVEDLWHSLIEKLKDDPTETAREATAREPSSQEDISNSALVLGLQSRVQGLQTRTEAVSREVLGVSWRGLDSIENSNDRNAQDMNDKRAATALNSLTLASREGVACEIPRRLRGALLGRFRCLLAGERAPFPKLLHEARVPIRQQIIAMRVFGSLICERGSGLLTDMLVFWGPGILEETFSKALLRCDQSQERIDSVFVRRLLAESLSLLHVLIKAYGDPVGKLLVLRPCEEILPRLVIHFYRESILLEELAEEEESSACVPTYSAALLVPERASEVRERVLLAKSVFDRLLACSSDNLQTLLRRVPIKYRLDSALHKLKAWNAQHGTVT